MATSARLPPRGASPSGLTRRTRPGTRATTATHNGSYAKSPRPAQRRTFSSPGSGQKVVTRQTLAADAGEENFVERCRSFVHDARAEARGSRFQFAALSVAQCGPLQAAA